MALRPRQSGAGADHDPALDELRQRYRDGELVLFVGAGISAAAGLPSWAKLVEQLVARAKLRGAAVDEIERLATSGRFVDAISAAAVAVGDAELVAVVRSALDDRRHVPDVPEILRAIAAMEPRLRAVLTTNLDHLLQRAFAGRWPELHGATGRAAQERGVILKLHGTLMDPRTWVLTRDQYDRAMYNDPSLADAVASVFRAHTLLFVGYGLADDDFDQVLARVRALSGAGAARHYALMLAEQVTPYWRKAREDAGIRIIPYTTHADIPAILRWLAEDDADDTEPDPDPTLPAVETDARGALGAPLVHLRLVGTMYAYQAAPGFSVLSVGRQRQKPGHPSHRGNDFVIRVPEDDGRTLRISRRQFEIARTGRDYSLLDRSRGNTTLNGRTLAPDEPVPLRPGDRIGIAGVVSVEFTLGGTHRGDVLPGIVRICSLDDSATTLVAEATVGDMITWHPGEGPP